MEIDLKGATFTVRYLVSLLLLGPVDLLKMHPVKVALLPPFHIFSDEYLYLMLKMNAMHAKVDRQAE